MGRERAWLLLLALAGCDRSPVKHLGPGPLSVEPAAVELGVTWLGHPRAANVTVHNDGEFSASVSVSVTGNFSVAASQLEVPAGANSVLAVTYAPALAGHDVGGLELGSLHVELSGDARAVPDCPAQACNEVSFDAISGECTSSVIADGTACHTACTSGSCEAGQCLGTLDSCDDGDVCTVELCGEPTGCRHTPRQCPAPSDPCQVASCDSKNGCGSTAAPDGTRCATDACYASTVHVCITGACVERPRASGRCTDVWYAPSMTARAEPAMAYDSDRQMVVLFGGDDGSTVPLSETWEWAGGRWSQVTTAVSPPGRSGASMIYDEGRKRMVLFGDGAAALDDTWEYDGRNWVQASPVHSPPAHSRPGFTYDSDRHVAVLFGGTNVSANQFQYTDTWEYDGVDWTQNLGPEPSQCAPGPIAYDEARQRVVLFTVSPHTDPWGDTWEYDGTRWTQANPGVSPPAALTDALTYDSKRQRVVLFIGGDAGTWEYDGTSWTQAMTTAEPSSTQSVSAAYDAKTQQTLIYGGLFNFEPMAETWGFDGANWADLDTSSIPHPRVDATAAYDAHRQRVVLFGGGGVDLSASAAQTWEWDGSSWSVSPVASGPAAPLRSAMVFDSARNTMVLFGGEDATETAHDDTWEFDGTAWTQRFAQHAPPARLAAAMAYDSKRQRTVLFGGTRALDASFSGTDLLGDTWEWDGNDWARAQPSSAPGARLGATMVYDEARQVTVLYGGSAGDDSVGVFEDRPFTDTWLWDGTQWSQVSTANGPGPRVQPAMTYDSKRQKVMMFGGWIDGQAIAELWAFDGVQWALRSPSTQPAPVAGATMTYDGARDELVVFGGSRDGVGSLSDTWIYVPPP